MGKRDGVGDGWCGDSGFEFFVSFFFGGGVDKEEDDATSILSKRFYTCTNINSRQGFQVQKVSDWC